MQSEWDCTIALGAPASRRRVEVSRKASELPDRSADIPVRSNMKNQEVQSSSGAGATSPSPLRSGGEGRGEEALRAHGETSFDVRCSRAYGEVGETPPLPGMENVQYPIRLGLRVVKNLSQTGAKRLLEARNNAPFASVADFKRRVHLNKDELRTLAEIGALNCFAAHRRDALWEVEKPLHQDDLFDSVAAVYDRRSTVRKTSSPLAPMNYPERIQADFAGMQLTTGAQPMALLRPRLAGISRAADLPTAKHGSMVRIAGSVICRQRPGTAKGFVFISLEDETGISNAIVTPPMFEAYRLVITEEPFLLIEGRLQHINGVIHVKAQRIERLQHAPLVATSSHDFR